MKHTDEDKLDTFQPIGLAAARVVSNLIKLRKNPEVLDGGSVVSDGSLNGSLECSDVNGAIVLSETSNKMSAAAGTCVDTLKTCGASQRNLVRVVLLTGRFPQIRKRIVAAVAVSVVNQIAWPASGHVEPSQTSGTVQCSVNTDDGVPLALACTSFSDQVDAMTALSNKDAGRGVIVEDFTESFGSKRHGSHPHEKQNEQPSSDTDPRHSDEEKRKQELEYVERRLADIRAFERRFTDGSRRKRKY